VPGLALDHPDDEERLAALLQGYARLKRKAVLVFFDKAAPGHAGERTFGTVRARFVPEGISADDAIINTLKGMGKGQRAQSSVVSSDRRVRAEAKALGAAVIASDAFARELAQTAASRRKGPPAPAGEGAALEEWYDLFGLDPDQAERPIDLKQRPKTGALPAGGASAGEKKPRKRHGFPKKGG
jgi:hypothetical protein